MGGDVDVLVAGSGAKAVADAAAKLDGVAKVLLADAPAYEQAGRAAGRADRLARRRLRRDRCACDHDGKNVMPRVAAMLDVMQVSDIIKVVAPDTFERPIYAGNAIQTVKSKDAKKVITVRTPTFQATGEGGSAPRSRSDRRGRSGHRRVRRRGAVEVGAPRAHRRQDHRLGRPRDAVGATNFTKYIEPLADKLGAAVGASRAAVDAGYAPND